MEDETVSVSFFYAFFFKKSSSPQVYTNRVCMTTVPFFQHSYKNILFLTRFLCAENGLLASRCKLQNCKAG